ncbi:AraC family transcriptional regulator [Paenibacillus ihumii]|uniref:AraC family transcriptional regulator n=1 Tax=Paenibacillus ihumii TaxID=687436 RepID=UPI0006D7DD21|nr:GyrI-like domain-containing protein [Paenibacillus ihumii]
MDIKVETLPNYRLAYVRQVGPYGPANIQAMEKLKKWAKAKDLLTESAILFGIPQDNPETTPTDSCRYDACIVIAKDLPIDSSVQEGELSGGEYVICRIKHTAEEIERTWQEIFPALHSRGYQIDSSHPILERYAGHMLMNDLCEICIPVQPS